MDFEVSHGPWPGGPGAREARRCRDAVSGDASRVSEGPTNPNSARAVETVRQFLHEMGFSPVERRLVDRTAFLVSFDGPADQGIAQIVDDGERFVFHFVLPGEVPAERRHAVSEFIARANWRLIEGSFQLDFDTGALRYRVGIDFSGTELSEPLIRNAMLTGMEAIETFAVALASVANGQFEPASAYRAISSKTFS